MTQPADQDIRDAAARDLETSFFLEAGAGTGKTRVLVDRVLEIVRQGKADIQQVVVITFTEKAAGELRSRIRESLHAGVDQTGDPERGRFLGALESLDAAHIETIHAFASSILREHPLESRIDPNFIQLDEVGDELDFEERWRDWLWSVSGPALANVERCLLTGMNLGTIRDIARLLARHREIDAMSSVTQTADAKATLGRIRETIRTLEQLKSQCANERDRTFQGLTEIAEKIGGLQGVNASMLEPGLMALGFNPRQGATRNWTSASARDQVYEGLQSISAELATYQKLTRTEVIAALVSDLSAFVRQAAMARLEEGKLNFEDLLIEARRLIRDDHEIRRRLQERYRFILVDEFQDTDPLQAEIVLLLAADPASASTPPADWESVTFGSGKLFVVGDPKQSIYRFRRADIDVFTRTKGLFERQRDEGSQARSGELIQNFRSVPSIVEWINTLFSQVITQNPSHPSAQPSYSEIHAYRSGSEPRVIHLYPTDDLGEQHMPEVRATEAEALARLISEMVGNPEWPIDGDEDTASGVARSIEFRDICILVDTRTGVDIYSDALTKRSIPFILDGGREFFQRQEIRDIAAILRALDDPSDQVSLIAALKSEAFACSDVELLEFRLKGGRFNILSPRIEDDPVSLCLARLKELYQSKGHHSLTSFVDSVIRETTLIESLLAAGEHQRAANLQLIVQRAADFASNDVDSLRPFIRWLSQRQIEGTRETESQINETDDDVVRISTIHGAKGLEFPVVILAKLAGGEWTERQKVAVDRAANLLEFEVGTSGNRFGTPGFEAAWAKEEIFQDAEARRLMYVGATRARDYLVVPIYKSARLPGKHQYLPAIPSWEKVVERGNPLAISGARPMIDREISGKAVPAPEVRQYPPDLVESWQKRAERIRHAQTQGPRYVVPSQLIQDLIKEPRETEPKDRSEPERDTGAQGESQRELGFPEGAAGLRFVGSTAGRQRGSLVHDVLYRCELDDPASAEAWADRLCQERGAEELTDEVKRHCLTILNSSYMKRVLESAHILREIPVAWFHEGTYTEGFVDLAFEERDGWVIMDYKTDHVGDSTDEIAKRYQPQIAAYRNALSAAGVNVKEAGFWFSDTGEARMAASS